MKNLLTITLLLLFASCKDQPKANVESTTSASEVIADINTLVDDPDEEGSKMLLGKIDKEGLAGENFPWFLETMKSYDAKDEVIDSLQKQLKNVTIKAFMGTWCEDSQREIPALYAVLNEANYNISTVEFFAVSQDKVTPQQFEKGLNIEYVPTIILHKEGKEMGRIVESTHKTLEEDLLAIASGEDYKHVYEE